MTRWRIWGARGFLFLALLLTSVALLANTGSIHWFGDLLAAFAIYIFGALVLLLLIGIWQRRWRWAITLGAAALLTLFTMLAIPVTGAPQPAATPPTLRLLVYNIYHLNPDLAAVVAEVERADADLVFLMEYSDAIQQQIEPAFSAYPYRLIEPSRFTMGLALFSRFPLEQAVVQRNPATRIPIFDVTVRVAETTVHFVGGHPWPPQLRWGQLHRDQMADITAVAAQAAHPLIVAGDFNAAPWSFVLADLAAQANLRHVRQQFDWRSTWSSLPLVGLQLDHVLVSPEWHIHAYEHGNAGGSDHVPLIIDLRLSS
jgi:endonuclease/exonuclease/phosphatase (EEP) superfamily protein YafD